MRRLFFYVLMLIWTVAVSAEDVDVQILSEVGLPVLWIETVNGELPTCEYIRHPEGAMGATITNATKVPARLVITKGDLTLYDSGDYVENESGITFRIRGNTSASRDKKPYKIKLQKKADLLCRGNDSIYHDKNWILLRDEKLFTKIGFKLNEMIGMQWTPAYEYVNVVVNGKYIGNYMLVESVSRNRKCRLDVEKTGFVFEYDPYWWNEDLYVDSPTLPSYMRYTFKYPDPEDITEDQLHYFKKMIESVEYSLKDGNYDKYIETNSFVNWLLVQDILGNGDGGGSNYYMTKYDDTSKSKVMMANLWDFDRIMIDENKWSNNHGGWFYYQILLKNGDFLRAYKYKFKEIAPTYFDEMIAFLDEYANSEEGVAVSRSLELNNQQWNDDYLSLKEYIDDEKLWFKKRKVWMMNAMNDINNISSPKIETTDNRFFNLQGVETPLPVKGIYIHQGKKYIKK